jgi:hypothetical protein
MAKIGSFGDLVFSVSSKTIKTFDEMSWKTSANYETHDRHLKADLLEFQGPELDTISFSIAFSVFLGTNPLNEIKKLDKIIRKGIAKRLVIGGKVYGSYKWVILDATKDLERFDNHGNLWAATVKLSIKEYAKR